MKKVLWSFKETVNLLFYFIIKMEELHREIDNCRLCSNQGFIAIPRPIDRGKGSRKILLIGQAPGNGEGTRKLAFGGPAGRKLMRWFGSIGLAEEQVRDYFYLSAISKCYPGRAPKGGGDRNPSPVERLNCRPFLLKEIQLIQPKVLILVGGTAIRELYGDKIKLDRIIGQTNTLTLGEIYERFSLRLQKRGENFPFPPPVGFDFTSEVQVFHLPHPSGASTWLNQPFNRSLLARTLEDLRVHLPILK